MKIKLILLLVTILHAFFVCTEIDSEIYNHMMQNNPAFVEFVFVDLFGNIKSVLKPISHAEKVFQEGEFFDGSSVKGFSTIFDSDKLLVPAKIYPVLHNDESFVRIMCDVLQEPGKPFQISPRYVLQSVLDKAKSMGYDFLVGPELEFFLFEKGKNLQTSDQQGYFDIDINPLLHELKKKILSTLLEQGINVEKIHKEVAPGQYEISLRYANALDMADNLIFAKHTIKQLASQNNLIATFMPKPIAGINGSGMHVHFSLYDTINNVNAFFDSSDENNLSQTAKYFIAGVLKHAVDFAAIYNPTVNSYKRLVVGYEAPVYVGWGKKNRSTLIRLPQGMDHPNAVRAELRCPDGMTNPYLAFAAILASGLEGIEKKYELPGSIDDNLYKITDEQIQSRGIEVLPNNLLAATLQFNQADISKKYLGEELVGMYTKLKLDEFQKYSLTISSWEISTYI